ncbi:MAG: aminopeptidase N [Propionibacteriaceae bacterium]|jgi:aminopeptidase N|nr:aminopeptidase N [Propionibacteriaceae bacterium]
MPGKNLTRQEAEARAALIAVRSYDIALDLTGPGDTFASRTTIRFACRQPGADTFADLVAARVKAVVLNGAALDPAVCFADSRIALPGLAADNELVVEAAAEWSHTGEGLHRFTDPADGQDFAYTQFEVADARRVFASFEQPDLKAVFTFHVTAPAAWMVVSNQPAERVEEAVSAAGAPVRIWHFEPTPVMSGYLTAVVAGPYVRWDDAYTSADGRVIPLSVLVRPSMAPYLDAAAVFDITKRGFAFYEQAFGVPYPYSTFDQAFVPEYNAGAMENIGLVTITENYVFRSKPTKASVDRRTITILHEQAHMWFGDLVTMRWWNDLWLNESFAEFMSHVAAAESGLLPDAWTTFQASEKSWGYSQDQLPSTHPVVADIPDLAAVEVNFDGITYAKGAAVLRQLAAWVGQREFLAGVSCYLKAHAYGNATLADLLAELEAASGRDLTAWSRVWLEEAGVTTLRPQLSVKDGRVASLDILQEAPPIYGAAASQGPTPTAATASKTAMAPASIPDRPFASASELAPPAPGAAFLAATTPVPPPTLRPARLSVGGYVFSPDGLVRNWSAEVDIDGPRSAVPAAVGRPQPDLLLVNDGDLAYAKLRLDEASFAATADRLAELRDPLARALVWGALWDATRDGELPGRRYIGLVLSAIAAETSSTVIQTLLRQLRTTLLHYVAPARRQASQTAAAARLADLAQTAPAGSDAQLQFFKAYAASACAPEQTEHLAAVFAGTAALPGLVLDADLRWELLTRLAAAGRLGEAAITAELERDQTTKGREQAAGARAALPGPAAKAAAWALALSDESITNAVQRSVIAGFTATADRGALAVFAAPYFDALEEVWATRSREMATNVVEGLYPSLALGQPGVDVIGATDRWLAAVEDRAPALRRLVTEGRAGVVRALAAQACDAAYDEG